MRSSRRQLLLGSSTAALVAACPALAQIVQFSGAPSAVDSFWTVFTATAPSGQGDTFNGAGTRQIFVAKSGSDSNHGTQASPYLTLAKGMAALRDGKPDWLLLNCGDTWTNETFGSLNVSGATITQTGNSANIGGTVTGAMIIGYYTGPSGLPLDPAGGVRPLLQNSVAQGVCGGGTGGNNFAIVGIEGYCYQRDPSNGSFANSSNNNFPDAIGAIGSAFGNSDPSWFLIEDCKLSWYHIGITAQLRANGQYFAYRRCVITDSYGQSSTNTHSQGSYIENPASFGVLVEQCLFDHNGWTANNNPTDSDRTEFNHGIYVQDDPGSLSGGPVTFRENIAINNSWAGLYQRPGGISYNNLMVGNGVGTEFGYTNATNSPTGTVTYNVVLNGTTVAGSNIGINVQRSTGVTAQNNIVAQATAAEAVALNADQSGANPGAANATITNNIIFKVTAGAQDSNPGHGNVVSPQIISDLTGANNLGSPEPFTRVTNADPVGLYYGSIGGSPATLAGFSAAARLQRKGNWNSALKANAVNNYIRAGCNNAIAQQ